jgi:hypothetical protein
MDQVVTSWCVPAFRAISQRRSTMTPNSICLFGAMSCDWIRLGDYRYPQACLELVFCSSTTARFDTTDPMVHIRVASLGTELFSTHEIC